MFVCIFLTSSKVKFILLLIKCVQIKLFLYTSYTIWLANSLKCLPHPRYAVIDERVHVWCRSDFGKNVTFSILCAFIESASPCISALSALVVDGVPAVIYNCCFLSNTKAYVYQAQSVVDRPLHFECMLVEA